MAIISDARANSLADTLDSAFRLYRRHFLRLAAIALIAGVPMLLAHRLLIQVILQGLSPSMIWLASFLVSLVVVLLFGNLLNAALISAVAQARHGGEISVAAAYRAGLRRYLPLLLASFVPIVLEQMMGWIAGVLQTPVTMLAYSNDPFGLGNVELLILAALVGLPIGLVMLCLYGQLFLYGQAVVLEDCGPIDGLARSWRLLAGGRARGVLLALLTRLLNYFFTSLPQLLFTLIFFRLADARELLGIAGLVVALLSLLVAAPLVNAIHTTFYYALRDRNEGHDIERSLSQATQ